MNINTKAALLAALGTCFFSTSATALSVPEQESELRGNELRSNELLGTGRLFSNDLIGDGADRWRSGSYSLSFMYGLPGDGPGHLPAVPGRLMEYRLRSEIIAPSVASGGVDRPYVGALAVGAFTHMGFGPTQLSFGAEALFVGPQTGVSDFQDWYHDVFSLPAPIGTQNQLDNEVFFNAQAEISWPVRISETVTIRPFLAAQSGAEDLVRVGADFVIGSIGHDDFVVRDTVTGQLIRAIEAPQTGFAFVGGFDWAQVGSSAFLPADAGFVALDERLRARAGVHWQVAPDVSVFYGATWLSEEFEGQSEGQLLGSLKLNFNF